MIIKDKDPIGYDYIGSYEININDVIGPVNKFANYKYIDIYGSSRNKNDDFNILINENAEIGPAWNGRILLRIDCKTTDTPTISKVDIKDREELQRANAVIKDVL